MKKAFTPHFPTEFEVIQRSGQYQKDAEFRDKHNGTLDYGGLRYGMSLDETVIKLPRLCNNMLPSLDP